jgi:hypothetical protein
MLKSVTIKFRKVKEGEVVSRQLSDSAFIGTAAPAEGLLVHIGAKVSYVALSDLHKFLKDESTNEIEIDPWEHEAGAK